MVKKKKNYIVIGSKSWNNQIFSEIISKYTGNWVFFENIETLTKKFLKEFNPRYIFFLHWSSLVPDEIISRFECICFHMTDVPYGRGGSPLQNLIIRGHRTTKLTALRMVSEFDAGPVYYKEDLSLEGNAEEIYIKATLLSAKIIKIIIQHEPVPEPQEGPVTTFKRRRPEESEIPETSSLIALHDFIRMLDAEGYPRSFIIYEGYKYEFYRAALYSKTIVSDVIITKIEDKQ
jgi:methionyl-tRNA formyltransferase